MLRPHSGLRCSPGSRADHCAKPLVTLPFVKRVNNNGPMNVIKQDRLRVERPRRQLNLEANNRATSHVASVGVGGPPMQCK